LDTQASAILVNGEALPRKDLAWVRVKNPHLAFARLLKEFHPVRRHLSGIEGTVAAGATVDASACVMAGAHVERGAVIGARSVLYPGVFVGEDAKVGSDCLLYPNVTVRERCVLGDRDR